MKAIMLIGIVLFLTGCKSNPQVSVSAGSNASDRFNEEAARTIACLDGLSRLELSGDVIFKPHEARCVERLSYLRQIKNTDEESAMTTKLGSLSVQIYLCHSAAALSSSRFSDCLAEESKQRDVLPGAIKVAAQK